MAPTLPANVTPAPGGRVRLHVVHGRTAQARGHALSRVDAVTALHAVGLAYVYYRYGAPGIKPFMVGGAVIAPVGHAWPCRQRKRHGFHT